MNTGLEQGYQGHKQIRLAQPTTARNLRRKQTRLAQPSVARHTRSGSPRRTAERSSAGDPGDAKAEARATHPAWQLGRQISTTSDPCVPMLYILTTMRHTPLDFFLFRKHRQPATLAFQKVSGEHHLFFLCCWTDADLIGSAKVAMCKSRKEFHRPSGRGRQTVLAQDATSYERGGLLRRGTAGERHLTTYNPRTDRRGGKRSCFAVGGVEVYTKLISFLARTRRGVKGFPDEESEGKERDHRTGPCSR